MFSRLHVYTVHRKPGAAEDKTEFVREGFSIYALAFGFFWALYHRMWLVAAGLFALNSCFVVLDMFGHVNPLSVMIVQLGVQLYIGFAANDWLRNHYARKGYITDDIVSGETLARAERRFFERLHAAA